MLNELVHTRLLDTLSQMFSDLLDASLLHHLSSAAFLLPLLPSLKVVQFMNSEVGYADLLSHQLLTLFQGLAEFLALLRN
jgi:hypothetical protein